MTPRVGDVVVWKSTGGRYRVLSTEPRLVRSYSTEKIYDLDALQYPPWEILLVSNIDIDISEFERFVREVLDGKETTTEDSVHEAGTQT